LAVVEASGLVTVLLLAAHGVRFGLERVHVAAIVLLQGHCERCGGAVLGANTAMG
jgi:hypothetical protein